MTTVSGNSVILTSSPSDVCVECVFRRIILGERVSNAYADSITVAFFAGAHIIDLMLLVVDVNKGFQTQTAECLVIGELTCDTLLVVLNKTDLIPADKRPESIAKVLFADSSSSTKS